MKDKGTLIRMGSAISLLGFLLSGPVGFALVHIIKPLPAWTLAASFAAQYSPWQNLPYYFGFVLVGGMLMLAVAHYLDANLLGPMDRMHILLSVVWTTIFAALILFNYICQTTFLHHLVTHYKPEYDTLIATLSMANPASLSWAIEMWGYGFLGVATWLLSAYYRDKNSAIYFLLIANGVVSLFSAVVFIYDGQWLLTRVGLTSYFGWNLLMMVLLVLVFRQAKKGSIPKENRGQRRLPRLKLLKDEPR